MRFVYATRPLPRLEFGTANELGAVPLDAEVLAVCDGAMTIRPNTYQTFSTLTDQEHSALEDLIVESQMSERTTAVGNGDGFVRRILRHLLNI